MQSIITRYRTDSHGHAYIIARASGGERLRVAYDYELSDAGNHCEAARALCIRLGWRGGWRMGAMPNASERVFVSTDASTYGFELPESEG